MSKFMRLLHVLLLLPCLLFGKIKSPSAVVLTWEDDPTTTMTIFWHSAPTSVPSYIHYCPAGETSWQTRIAAAKTPSDVLTIHHVALSDLRPGTYYYFRIDNDPALHAFQTLSDDPDHSLRFVVGGDAYHSFLLNKQTNQAAAATDPDFAILGGDIAYTLLEPVFFKRRGWEERRWHTFFEQWSIQMVDSMGCHIPLLIVPGNHDVKGPPTQPTTLKTLFYDFYPLKNPLRTYKTLAAHPLIQLFLLDTGHGQEIEGSQTEWLQRQLRARQNITYKIAVYHKAAYPSYYSFDKPSSKLVRESWTPLFDAYGLTIAFENDNHTYKRTYPIKNQQIDEAGTLYLGDGAWGVKARKPYSPSDLWYLARSARLNHFFLVELIHRKISIQALDNQGHLIETINLPQISNN